MVEALKDQLESYATKNGDTVASETLTRTALRQSQDRAAKLERVLGAAAGVDPDMSSMAARLAEFEEQVKVAESKAKAAELVRSSL